MTIVSIVGNSETLMSYYPVWCRLEIISSRGTIVVFRGPSDVVVCSAEID